MVRSCGTTATFVSLLDSVTLSGLYREFGSDTYWFWRN